ncbi:hypothetical protein DPMN_162669 [Dreissena polymorpha]|uniref:Uncharacterized protein n=1 Tax=Dreissena polymorpha TaxID=45954 RepID=A0A9D4ER00_DREPO|nr:hypothetical protein DPMN_162669 [Dreissena polymorpha]
MPKEVSNVCDETAQFEYTEFLTYSEKKEQRTFDLFVCGKWKDSTIISALQETVIHGDEVIENTRIALNGEKVEGTVYKDTYLNLMLLVALSALSEDMHLNQLPYSGDKCVRHSVGLGRDTRVFGELRNAINVKALPTAWLRLLDGIWAVTYLKLLFLVEIWPIVGGHASLPPVVGRALFCTLTRLSAWTFNKDRTYYATFCLWPSTAYLAELNRTYYATFCLAPFGQTRCMLTSRPLSDEQECTLTTRRLPIGMNYVLRDILPAPFRRIRCTLTSRRLPIGLN